MKTKIEKDYEEICEKVNELSGVLARVIKHNGEIFIGFYDNKGRAAYSERKKNE